MLDCNIALDGSSLIDGLQLRVASNCDEVRVYSRFIDGFTGASDEILITIYNLLTEEDVSSVTLTDGSGLTNDGTYDYYPLDTSGLGDGVFRITLKNTPDAGTITTQKSCLFLDCDLKCDLATAPVEALMYHWSLIRSMSCGCDCDGMANRYRAMLAVINMSTDEGDCISTTFSDCFDCN